MPDLSPSTLEEMPEGFRVELASLSEEGQEQVVEAITAAQDAGTLDDAAVHDALDQAAQADTHRENVEDLHQQQADAASSGDYAKAADLASQAEYQLKEVQDHGGDADEALVRADADVTHLESAQANADTAHEMADYANHLGTPEAADAAMQSAGNYAATAAQEGAAGDQGGHYADHSYSAPATTEDPATIDTSGAE